MVKVVATRVMASDREFTLEVLIDSMMASFE